MKKMKVATIGLFLVIGGVFFASGLWLFQRRTASQETAEEYKTSPVLSSLTASETQAEEASHSHSEGSAHSHAHESPSDSMIRIARETFGENPPLESERWLAYLESEEGRAFLDGFPSADEWFEKSKEFGFFEETPAVQGARDGLYRKHFPTGTVGENEHIIRDMMRDAILEQGHHKESEYSRSRNSTLLIDLLMDEKYLAWVEMKFGSLPPSSQEWINATFEEIRLAERKKYLAAENNESPAQVNGSTGSEPPQSEIELRPADNRTPATPRDLSEGSLTVGNGRSDAAITHPIDIEKLAIPVPEVPELPNREGLETALRTQFSPDRFTRAMNTLTEYGPEEGLRRLKVSDPEVAKQVEGLLPKQQEQEK